MLVRIQDFLPLYITSIAIGSLYNFIECSNMNRGKIANKGNDAEGNDAGRGQERFGTNCARVPDLRGLATCTHSPPKAHVPRVANPLKSGTRIIGSESLFVFLPPLSPLDILYIIRYAYGLLYFMVIPFDGCACISLS